MQETRVAKYRALDHTRNEIYAAIKAVTEDDPSGPCGQGPFTGNMRESRQVASMMLHFSPTRGGAPAVDMSVAHLNIEASELGRFIEARLRAKLELVNAEIEKL